LTGTFPMNPGGNPPPSLPSSIAANGLSIGGNIGSTSVGVRPGSDSGDRDKGPPAMRACINCCCCCSDQTEGSGMLLGLNPAARNGFGTAPSEAARTLRGEGEPRIGGGVGMILSSPRKVSRLVLIVGSGGSIVFRSYSQTQTAQE
jgi:hypothetical protein